MPSVTDKQRRFFGAVMGAKKGKKGPSGKAKEVASEMSEEQIKDFLKKSDGWLGLIGAAKLAQIERGHTGRGAQGACGGERKRDGSGKGVGNIGTERQPAKKAFDKKAFDNIYPVDELKRLAARKVVIGALLGLVSARSDRPVRGAAVGALAGAGAAGGQVLGGNLAEQASPGTDRPGQIAGGIGGGLGSAYLMHKALGKQSPWAEEGALERQKKRKEKTAGFSDLSPSNRAMLAGAGVTALHPLVVAGLGALTARKGKRWAGAGYGALAGLGGVLGREAGGAAVGIPTWMLTHDRGLAFPAAAAGATAGDILGILGTLKAIKKLKGKESPWYKEEKKAQDISMELPETKSDKQVPPPSKMENESDTQRDASNEKVDKPPYDVTTAMDSQEKTVDPAGEKVAAYCTGFEIACAERGIDPAALLQ